MFLEFEDKEAYKLLENTNLFSDNASSVNNDSIQRNYSKQSMVEYQDKKIVNFYDFNGEAIEFMLNSVSKKQEVNYFNDNDILLNFKEMKEKKVVEKVILRKETTREKKQRLMSERCSREAIMPKTVQDLLKKNSDLEKALENLEKENTKLAVELSKTKQKKIFSYFTSNIEKFSEIEKESVLKNFENVKKLNKYICNGIDKKFEIMFKKAGIEVIDNEDSDFIMNLKKMLLEDGCIEDFMV
jgi:hypothetical protein